MLLYNLEENFSTDVKYNVRYLDKIRNVKQTIAVDWFQCFGRFEAIPIPTEADAGVFQNISDNIMIVYLGFGRGFFKYVFEVYFDKEKIGEIEFSPTSGAIEEMNMYVNSGTIKLENHLLYTENWLDIFFETISRLAFQVQNVSRLDLAIDNCKYIKDFMNFAMQQNDCEKIAMCGKAKINAKDFDWQNKDFSYFAVGSPYSAKQLVIYNKTQEINQASNKKYIEKFWIDSGMDINDKEVYRLEMRMRSECTKYIQDFEIGKLNDAQYLASIFQTQAKNFFEFRYDYDSNSSRNEKIELIDYEKLGAKLLSKIRRGEVKDVYKAKLTIHLLYRLFYEKRCSNEFWNDSKTQIKYLLGKFELKDWLNEKYPKWFLKYTKESSFDIVKKYFESEAERIGVSLPELIDKKILLCIDYEACKLIGLKDVSYNKFLHLVKMLENSVLS